MMGSTQMRDTTRREILDGDKMLSAVKPHFAASHRREAHYERSRKKSRQPGSGSHACPSRVGDSFSLVEGLQGFLNNRFRAVHIL